MDSAHQNSKDKSNWLRPWTQPTHNTTPRHTQSKASSIEKQIRATHKKNIEGADSLPTGRRSPVSITSDRHSPVLDSVANRFLHLRRPHLQPDPSSIMLAAAGPLFVQIRLVCCSSSQPPFAQSSSPAVSSEPATPVPIILHHRKPQNHRDQTSSSLLLRSCTGLRAQPIRFICLWVNYTFIPFPQTIFFSSLKPLTSPHSHHLLLSFLSLLPVLNFTFFLTRFLFVYCISFIVGPTFFIPSDFFIPFSLYFFYTFIFLVIWILDYTF